MNLYARRHVSILMNSNTQQIYDEWLVLRCQTGDPDAVEMLVRRWQTPLLRFATIVTRDPDLAKEALQETWISVMRGITRLNDSAKYRQWLFRIVHNKCVDALRSRGPVSDTAEAAEHGRTMTDAVDDRETIDRVLAGLTEDHRSVLALHYLYEMEIAEIADLLAIPLGTVKSRLFNAREAFKRVLEHEGEADERPGRKNRAGVEGRYRFGWHF
jgi:RNA polymerase sigma factor (sigma-70 family)